MGVSAPIMGPEAVLDRAFNPNQVCLVSYAAKGATAGMGNPAPLPQTPRDCRLKGIRDDAQNIRASR